MDKRRDAGEFYPDGKVIATRPIARGGDMKHNEFEALTAVPARFTDTTMREKLNQVIGLLKGGAAAFALTVALDVLLGAFSVQGAGVTVETAPKGAIFNDEPVVTNVNFDATGLAAASNVYTKAETEAKIVELAPAPGDYANVSNAAMTAVQPGSLSFTNDYIRTSWADDNTSEFAGHANEANYADNAGTAEWADYASSAGDATEATHSSSADWATYADRAGISDFSDYAKKINFGANLSDAKTGEEMLALNKNYTDNATNALARVAHTGSYNDLTNKPTIPTVPTNVSAFNNDAGYLTGYTESDPTVPAWAKSQTKPSYTASEVGAATTSALDEVGDRVTGNGERLASLNLQLSDGYDMFLSVAGDDANDGLTRLSAKRTIQGCYDAATNDAIVCVMPGIYEPPPLKRGYQISENIYDVCPSGYTATNALHFVAQSGATKTIITGGLTNALCIVGSSANSIFEGFTIANLSGGGSGSVGSWPAFCGVNLVDCIVEATNAVAQYSWALFNDVLLSNTVVHIDSVSGSAGGREIHDVFAGCTFIDSDIFLASFDESMDRGVALYKCPVAQGTLFRLPKVTEPRPIQTSGRIYNATNCTFIFDAADITSVSNAFYALRSAANCYFCVGTGCNGFKYADPKFGNVFAPSWTNTCLDAAYVPTIECPAVRDDGRKDAGWRDSGLGPEKTAAALASAAAANRGEIAALSNETAFALADLRDYTDGQLQNCYQQSVGYTDQMASNALALVMLEAATLRDEIAALTNGVPAVAALTASNTVDALLTPSPLTVEYGNDVTNSFVLAKDWVTQAVVFDRVDGESGPVMNTRCSLYSAGRLRNYSLMIDEIPEDTLGECVNMSFVDLTNAVPRVYASPAFYDFNIDGMIDETPCYGWLITTNDIPCVISFRQPEGSICIVTREKLEN